MPSPPPPPPPLSTRNILECLQFALFFFKKKLICGFSLFGDDISASCYILCQAITESGEIQKFISFPSQVLFIKSLFSIIFFPPVLTDFRVSFCCVWVGFFSPLPLPSTILVIELVRIFLELFLKCDLPQL